MASKEYVRTDTAAFEHTLGTGVSTFIAASRSDVSLRIGYKPLGFTAFYPVTFTARSGLGAGDGAIASQSLAGGGVLHIQPASAQAIDATHPVHIAVVEY